MKPGTSQIHVVAASGLLLLVGAWWWLPRGQESAHRAVPVADMARSPLLAKGDGRVEASGDAAGKRQVSEPVREVSEGRTCLRVSPSSPASGPAPLTSGVSAAGTTVAVAAVPEADARRAVALVNAMREGQRGALRADEEALLRRCVAAPDGVEGLPEAEAFALRNDAMDCLWAGGADKEALFALMAALYADRRQDEVMRDYAIQHVGQWYEHLPDRGAAGRLLEDALHETQSSIAGTALLALSRLAETCPEVKRDDVARSALALARDEATGKLARITALQVGAGMGLRELLPVAARWAGADVEPAVRVSAVAALGRYREPAAIGLLEQYASDRDAWVARAARAALRRDGEEMK